MQVSLAQVLEARERRVFRQMQLMERFEKSLISFSMNIPGPVKDSPLIRRAFLAGCRALAEALPEGKILHSERIFPVTGCEALYVVDLEPRKLKAITTAIEDTHALGRLFDMDVIGPDGSKPDREAVGSSQRGCMVCGAPGRGCASRRVHSVDELQRKVRALLIGYFRETDGEKIAVLAVQSLLDEVMTTPKPGLVDRRNSGSHRDMDVSTFRASAGALAPYFRRCVEIGRDTASDSPGETFRLLRTAGLEAEQTMYAATGGVNTHKGAVFTMGILCGATGRLWTPEGRWEEAELFREVAAMTRDAMESDFRRGGDTVGHRLFSQSGIRGVRGQVADGLPAVVNLGLPVYRACRSRGADQNTAGVRTLLTLIASVEDTNMIARGGLEGAKAGVGKCADLISFDYSLADVEALDDWFIERNLSPGGCADLLAAVYFADALLRGDACR